MDFREYQQAATGTAIYPGQGGIEGLAYAALGLNGEAGEVAEKVKKLMRDHDGVITTEIRLSLIKELGDVLWYHAQLCTELEAQMEYVAVSNIEKLRDRKSRAMISGDGDER